MYAEHRNNEENGRQQLGTQGLISGKELETIAEEGDSVASCWDKTASPVEQGV